VLICFATLEAKAIPIDGSISFVGGVEFNTSEIMSFTSSFTLDATGDYAVVPDLIPGTLTPFVFQPMPKPPWVTPLWTFDYGGKTYSFDVKSVIVDEHSATTLTLEGTGIGHISGFDDTGGTWIITTNHLGGRFSYSASTAVPEPSILLLLGSGLVAFALPRKMRK
jgi:hypothetical protein